MKLTLVSEGLDVLMLLSGRLVAYVRTYDDSTVSATPIASSETGPFVAVKIETPARHGGMPTEVHMNLDIAHARRLAETILGALPADKEEAAA